MHAASDNSVLLNRKFRYGEDADRADAKRFGTLRGRLYPGEVQAFPDFFRSPTPFGIPSSKTKKARRIANAGDAAQSPFRRSSQHNIIFIYHIECTEETPERFIRESGSPGAESGPGPDGRGAGGPNPAGEAGLHLPRPEGRLRLFSPGPRPVEICTAPEIRGCGHGFGGMALHRPVPW